MHFVSFLSGGFITGIEVNPPEKKLEKRTSVQCALYQKHFLCQKSLDEGSLIVCEEMVSDKKCFFLKIKIKNIQLCLLKILNCKNGQLENIAKYTQVFKFKLTYYNDRF